MLHHHSANHRRGGRRALALVALGAATASFTLLSHAAVGAEGVPGDPHSPVVASLASRTLIALSTAGFSGSTGGDNDVFRRLLLETAEATANEVGASPREMQLEWLAADGSHQVALLTALTQLGADYQSMSSDPDVGFDCSGLTSYAWRQAGYDLSRQSGDQIAQASARDEATAMAGDLVQYPGHVMMYLGTDDAVVHASNPQNDVELYILSPSRAESVRYGDPTAEED